MFKQRLNQFKLNLLMPSSPPPSNNKPTKIYKSTLNQVQFWLTTNTHKYTVALTFTFTHRHNHINLKLIFMTIFMIKDESIHHKTILPSPPHHGCHIMTSTTISTHSYYDNTPKWQSD